MEINEFIDFMREEFSNEKVEKKADFFETFFYYKRNLRDFNSAIKSYSVEEQQKVISFLLHLYPLSDYYIFNIFRENNITIEKQITFDTLNYICNDFEQNIGKNFNFDSETNILLKSILDIRDIIDFNQVKLSKYMMNKREYLNLKEKDQKLASEIKELESSNIIELKSQIEKKQRLYDELKTDSSEINKQLDKLNNDLNELSKYADVRDKVEKCREILKEAFLPEDYTDKQS